MNTVPFIPESAPFTLEQRAWLNGFLSGMYSAGSTGSLMEVAPVAPQDTEPLLILFGSQTGTAEGLAKKMANECRQRGFVPTILPLNEFGHVNWSVTHKAVIISSTWGDGEPPDNAVDFWKWINAESAPRFENLNYAVLGLGDRNYSDFCGASKKIDERLAVLGAKRLAPRGECDTDYEAPAKAWMDKLWEKLANGAAVTLIPPANANGRGVAAAVASGQHDPVNQPLYSKNNPFPARLLTNSLLNKPGSGKEVRHFEIELGGSGLTYEVGDALGVIPENNPELVEGILSVLAATGDEPVAIGQNVLPLRLALTQRYDVAKPSTELLAEVGKRAPESELASLLAPDQADSLKKWLFARDVLDVLGLAPKKISFTDLLPLLRKLAPRLYSISSSPKAHPSEVHLTVGTVRYDAHGRKRGGVASTFLADHAAKCGRVKVFVQPSHGFKPPTNGDTPMIMVGPGTGIAPFRAFLEERAAMGARGKNWLFFGDQRMDTDFLYEAQLTAWQKAGLLTRLDLAFSRDQQEKVYVQDRMRENAAELWRWLEAGAHFYVCGDASRMAKDVEAALLQVIETVGGKSLEAAQAYVAGLKADKRYQRDVY